MRKILVIVKRRNKKDFERCESIMGKELSDREIMELYRKDKCKGNEAIIDKYSNYIHKAICKQCPTWLREKNDLYQAGCEGIMYALKGYDADKGTFLIYCRGFVKKALGDQVLFFLGESSEYYANLHRKIMRAIDKIQLAGRIPTVEAIMEETKISRKLIKRELMVNYTRVSYEMLGEL